MFLYGVIPIVVKDPKFQLSGDESSIRLVIIPNESLGGPIVRIERNPEIKSLTRTPNDPLSDPKNHQEGIHCHKNKGLRCRTFNNDSSP